MKKLFAILIGLLFAISAFAVDTDQTPVWTVGPKSGGSYAIYHVVVTDSNTFDVADTSVSFPGLPWGQNAEFPDAICLYGVFTEIGTNSAACGDCLSFNIDVNIKEATKAADTWKTITNSSGSITYASRTGKTDTLTGITEAGSGIQVYAFTSTQLATAFPYYRIRWTNAEGASTVTTDSFCVDWYVIYTLDRDK